MSSVKIAPDVLTMVLCRRYDLNVVDGRRLFIKQRQLFLDEVSGLLGRCANIMPGLEDRYEGDELISKEADLAAIVNRLRAFHVMVRNEERPADLFTQRRMKRFENLMTRLKQWFTHSGRRLWNFEKIWRGMRRNVLKTEKANNLDCFKSICSKAMASPSAKEESDMKYWF